jgi:NADH:ubiquinone oxidoreductase subunit 2 (subunit N)
MADRGCIVVLVGPKGSGKTYIGSLVQRQLTLGNFTALHQNNLKRLLAYSSISHAGYALMGLSGIVGP